MTCFESNTSCFSNPNFMDKLIELHSHIYKLKKYISKLPARRNADKLDVKISSEIEIMARLMNNVKKQDNVDMQKGLEFLK